LEEQAGGAGESGELGFDADVPVDVVFEDESGGDVLGDDSGGC
jgi:hypothetical protein